MSNVESHTEEGGQRRAPDGRIFGGGYERIPKTLEEIRERGEREQWSK